VIAKLTHANTKAEVFVAVPLVFASYYSEATKCTHVLAAGGAIIPVSEDPKTVMEFVRKHWIIKELVKSEIKREKNEVQGKTKGTKQLSKNRKRANN
jgi:hypothetical protein